MSQHQSNAGIEAKKQESNSMVEEIENQFSIATSLNDGKSPLKICNLNVDCWHEVFDLLSLEDIHSVGKTCTRLQLIAGDYYRTNFNGAHVTYDEDNGFVSEHCSIPAFDEFFECLVVHLSITKDYGTTEALIRCKSLKNISFHYNDLNVHKIVRLQSIFMQMKAIKFNGVNFSGEFYECMLKYCPNLKYLSVFDRYEGQDVIIGTNNDWLLHHYPALEHFELKIPMKVPNLATFFELNPQLKSFRCCSQTLFNNIETFQQLRVGFGDLMIDLCYEKYYRQNEEVFLSNCLVLNQLYDQGIYKRLHLMTDRMNIRLIDQINLIRGLKMLRIRGYFECENEDKDGFVLLSKLVSVNELVHFHLKASKAIDAKIIAKYLVNIERLCIRYATPEQIRSFIQHLPKLKVFTVMHIDNYDAIDVSAWNEEREKLKNARKFTLYIGEESYLQTIWTTKKIDFKMIDIKRMDSCEWNPFKFDWRM